LTVNASYKNGITSKDDLRITGGIITVTAPNDAIRGRDSIGVKEGSLTVTAGGDGMQSNNDEDPERGYVAIDGGTIAITAEGDSIQAETTLLIAGGDLSIQCGDGSASGRQRAGGPGGFDRGLQAQTAPSADTTGTENASASDSAKGLKAGAVVEVQGGSVNVDSADDAVHSNSVVTISGGSLTLASANDGIHADSRIKVDGGAISITRAYEGVESAEITVNDGTIHVVSSGDGLDILGPIQMTGGTVIISGPTNDGNGPLDYGGEFKITAGIWWRWAVPAWPRLPAIVPANTRSWSTSTNRRKRALSSTLRTPAAKMRSPSRPPRSISRWC
jgi:hypothetical protein